MALSFEGEGTLRKFGQFAREAGGWCAGNERINNNTPGYETERTLGRLYPSVFLWSLVLPFEIARQSLRACGERPTYSTVRSGTPACMAFSSRLHKGTHGRLAARVVFLREYAGVRRETG